MYEYKLEAVPIKNRLNNINGAVMMRHLGCGFRKYNTYKLAIVGKIPQIPQIPQMGKHWSN